MRPSRPFRPRRRPVERGSGAVVVIAAAVLLTAFVLALTSVDVDSLFASRADRVAREAAQAGAGGGREEAWLVAAGRGGALVDFRLVGEEAVVTVDVAGVRGQGRARRDPAELALLAGRSRQGLAPEMLAAVGRADALLGRPVPIVSGRRTGVQQAALYAARAGNPYPVAPPGLSKHESGLAVDVDLGVAPRLAALATRTGLCQPYPATDPVHFELCH